MTGAARRILVPALLIGLLTGCTLIDQDTFAPSPEARPVAAPAPPAPLAVDPRTALVTINYATLNPTYQEPLRYAIRAAETRDPRVEYDVIAMVPSLDQAAAGQERALSVMRAITEQRVPARRVHLGLRADPSLTDMQVRVYLR